MGREKHLEGTKSLKHIKNIIIQIFGLISVLFINFKWKWFPFNVTCILVPVHLIFLNCLDLPAYTLLSVCKSVSSFFCQLQKTSKVQIFNSVWKSISVISASGMGSISISKIITTSLVGWLNIRRKTAWILKNLRMTVVL